MEHRLPGLDRRFYAGVVDRALVWGLAAAVCALVVLVGSVPALVAVVAMLGTAVLAHLVLAVVLGLKGTSPGRALTDVAVVHERGEGPVGVGRALLRQSVLGLAGLPTFHLGTASLALTVLLDPERRHRGWHDRLARSVVVDLRPPAQEEPTEERPRAIVNLTAQRLVPAPERPVTSAAAAPSETRTPETRQPDIGTPQARAPERPQPPTSPPPSSPPPSGPPPSSPPPTYATGSGSRQAPGARWRLTTDTGEVLLVHGLVLVGRRPEPRPGERPAHLLALTSADMSVSKTHAQLSVADDGSLGVMDRGSTNGSVLERRGVPRDLSAGRGTTVLDGDRIVLGDRTLDVRREQA